MKSVGYYNGTFGPLEEMQVPMGDRAVYFGDGCYDATYAVNKIPFALEEHMDRFYNSCRLLEIPFDMPREELRAVLMEATSMVDDDSEHMLYWQASRGTCPRNHVFPGPEVKPNLMITVRPLAMKPLSQRFRLISMEDRRFYFCNIKTLNLIPSVLANQRAKEHGCDEVVFHRGSRVTECAHSNILMLSGGVLCTAPTDELILPGITRKHLLELARENGISTDESPFSMVELMNADEIIVSSSGALCMAVDSIDGIPVGGKDPDRLAVLQKAYREKFDRATAKV